MKPQQQPMRKSSAVTRTTVFGSKSHRRLLCVFLASTVAITTAPAIALDFQVISTSGSGRATAYVESNKIVTLDGKTHVSWLDSNSNGFEVKIKTLDHATDTWTSTYTLGPADDNHGGPALTVDSDGYLHAVYYPHHEPMRYRKSLNPNDSTAWSSEVLFSDNLTYPSLVTGPDDTLYMIARTSDDSRWALNFYSKPKNGAWSAPTTILRADQTNYSHFQATLAWGPDHETLHLSTRMYGDTPRWGYKVGYMKSSDFGDSWQTSDGTALSLPATRNTIDTIEEIDISEQARYDHASALRAGSIAVSPNGVPHVLYNTRDDGNSVQAWIATADGNGGWSKIALNGKIDALPEDWGLGVPGGITFTDQGHMVVLLSAYASGYGWGSPGTEVIAAISADGGKTFVSKLVSDINPDIPNWLPSIERATGFNEIDSIHVAYTSGEEGANNQSIVSNDVLFGELIGRGWNGIEGDINQDGVFFGDGTGTASEDDVTAFLENWGRKTTPGLFGTYESITQDDLNFDGKVDIRDVAIMRLKLLQHGFSAAALSRLTQTVPEPSGIAIILLAAAIPFLRRYRLSTIR